MDIIISFVAGFVTAIIGLLTYCKVAVKRMDTNEIRHTINVGLDAMGDKDDPLQKWRERRNDQSDDGFDYKIGGF